MAPRRKGKKGTLNYALEVCDQGQITSIISAKPGLDGKEILEVMNCIRRRREIIRDNVSPLQGAVSLGHYNICKQLVEEGAVLSSTSPNIPHPLCLALRKGRFDIAHILLEAGADVSLACGDSLPLSFALDHENCTVQIVKEIIDAGFPKDGVVDLSSGRTALHSAIKENHLPIVKYLLSISVNPNVKDKCGLSPFHYAVQENFPDIVRLLAEKGAKIDCECSDHFTPMFYAIAMDRNEMVELLIYLGADIHYVNGNKKSSLMPLHFAANLCKLKITQLLLENGADVNRKVPKTGEIALHSAARSNVQNIPQSKIALNCIIEMLVKQGSNLNERHKSGLTPLQVAIKAKNFGVAKILVLHGSDLNLPVQVKNGKCYTTFHIAAKSFDKEFVKLCFDFGANCHALNEEGLSPCHLALLSTILDVLTDCAECTQIQCQNHTDQLSILKMFWKYGYPFDQTFEIQWLRNNTPPFPTIISTLMEKQKMLFSGLKTQQLWVVQKAVQQGAEVNCCSTDIPYPIHYIAARGNESILKLFLSKGCQANCIDSNGETPLHVAAKAGHVDCCRLLLEYGACYDYSSKNCSSTPLDLAMKNNHTEIVVLLTLVRKYFKDIKKGQFKLKPEMKIFNAVMNCCGRDGKTFMGRALQFGVIRPAERLMEMRAQIPSSY